MTQYEYENLGNGISIPCAHMDLTGFVDSPARKELTEEIYGIIDRQGALLLRDTGLETTRGFSEFLSSIGYHHPRCCINRFGTSACLRWARCQHEE